MVAREAQDSFDLGWSDQTLADNVQTSEQPPVPLDNSDDEPTRVATSAAAVVAESAVLDLPAAELEALDASDIHDEGARVTEPGLAPPPPTSAEIAAAELAAAASRASAVAAEPAPVESRVSDTPRTAPPIMNPPPVELGRAAASAEPSAAPAEARAPAAELQLTAVMPAVSIPPPPIAPGFFTPASLAPTAVDWNEFASPSLLATMKRTRPTTAWTGVGLLLAAVTFAGGIGIGLRLNPPAVPPVPVPAPLPASVAAAAASPTSTPAGTTQLRAAPVALPKPLAPFDAKAALAVVDDAANAAGACRATGDPKGTIPTTITFGPDGKVANVAINSSRYAGTKTAKCVAARLSEAHVSEFSGSPEPFKKTVNVR